MFFLIPFGIFVVSAASVGWVIGRKFVYLKKLNPETIADSPETQENFWAEFFPGLSAYFKRANVAGYKLNILAEFEKFLRKLRLFSLKIDTATNGLIHRVRKSAAHHEDVISSEADARAEQEATSSNVLGKREKKDPKQEEQGLIIDIAKNPKSSQLYIKLGNIYMKTGEWYDAAESFKKAVELDSEDESVKIKLERAIKKLEKRPE